MELLPVRSFFAEALASLYVVSGQKAADGRARELEERIPAAQNNADGLGEGDEDGVAGLGDMEAGAVQGDEGSASEARPRVRRFRS